MQLVDQNQNPAVNSYLNTNWRASIDSDPTLVANTSDLSHFNPTQPTAPPVETSILESIGKRSSVSSTSSTSRFLFITSS